MKIHPALLFLALVGAESSLIANPTGGSIAGGSASIGGQGTSTVTVNQTSNTAVINWGTFSINSGELTKFVQPNSSSAVLNRVTGGGTSLLNGTLSANGQVFLVNGNGIIVGAGGVINAAGFTASTRDISDSDFLSGNYHFSGSSDAGVQNFGVINALGGDAILIGKTVDNQGTINAPNGTVGLAAADDVLITQSGEQHVFVKPSASASSATGKVGISNSGKIAGAAAELRAANGNVYALAINNTGTVRATGVSNKNGHVYLIADSGSLKSTGTVRAANVDGKGGEIETSAEHVSVSGTVKTGRDGLWLIDPTSVVIDNGSGGENEINATTLMNQLASSDVGIQAYGDPVDTGDIILNVPLKWSSTSTLSLFALHGITLNGAITATKGGLSLQGGPGDFIIPQAAISVAKFYLQGGNFVQVIGQGGLTKLPTFTASQDFELLDGSFERFGGGDGSTGNPYQIVDVYGLQGIGSSPDLLVASLKLTKALNLSATTSWNSGLGFVPIDGFGGTFDGNKQALSGLTLGQVDSTQVGLFNWTGPTSTIQNVNLTNVKITGASNVGALAATNEGLIQNCTVSGTITGSSSDGNISYLGGLVGANSGTIKDSSNSATIKFIGVDYADHIGGVAGSNESSDLVNCFNKGAITFTGVNGFQEVGGVVGYNGSGEINSCYNTGKITGVDSVYECGGVVGHNVSGDIVSSYNTGAIALGDEGSEIGGVVGWNEGGSVSNSRNSGAISFRDDGDYIGGIAGDMTGEIVSSYNTGKITGRDGADKVGGLSGNSDADVTSSYNTGSITVGGIGSEIGGLIGAGEGEMNSSYNTAKVTVGDDAEWIGGLVGSSGYDFTNSHNTGAVQAKTGAGYIGGLAGESYGFAVNSYNTGTVTVTTDTSDIGGLIGRNNSANVTSTYNTGNVTVGANPESVGGLIGYNAGNTNLSYNTGAVTVGTEATDIGGLIGYTYTGSVISSHNTGAVKSGVGGSKIGGLVGASPNGGTITMSYNTGAVTATLSNGVAGLVGFNDAAITYCYNTGAVLGTVSKDSTQVLIGGVVSYNDVSGTISDSYNTGSVSIKGSVSGSGVAAVAGLVALNVHSGEIVISNTYSTGKVSQGTNISSGGLIASTGTNTVSSSYWDTQTSGISMSNGGFGETTAQMGMQATFVGWDFGTIWTIGAGTAPYFQATGGPNNTANYGGPLPKP